jgi:putative transposase
MCPSKGAHSVMGFLIYRGTFRLSRSLWQGRYYSCPLDQTHLWEALRYTELNPVRAGLASDAGSWKWSTAAVHCGQQQGDVLLALKPWQRHWSDSAWREYLRAGEKELDLVAIRRCTYTGRPLGTAEFIKELKQKTRRRLTLRKGGHPRKLSGDTRQGELTFDG